MATPAASLQAGASPGAQVHRPGGAHQGDPHQVRGGAGGTVIRDCDAGSRCIRTEESAG